MSDILGFMVAALIVFTPILIFILSVRKDRNYCERTVGERLPRIDNDIRLKEWP